MGTGGLTSKLKGGVYAPARPLVPLFRLDALRPGPDALDRPEPFLLLALSSVLRGREVMM